MKFRLFLLTLSLFGYGTFAHATDNTEQSAVIAACQTDTPISDEQFKTLVHLGEQLSSGKVQLQLPKDCPADKTPYITSLQVAAQQKSTEDLAKTLDMLIPEKQSIEEKAELDSTLLRYIKVACGPQLSCVTNTIHAMPHLKVAESPIFCAFTRFADYSVQVYFQTQKEPIYPVACLGNSALTKGMGLSPMQDWFEAYKLLGN